MPQVTDGSCLSQQPIRDGARSQGADPNRNRPPAPIRQPAATLAGVQSEYKVQVHRNVADVCVCGRGVNDGLFDSFYVCVCFVCSSEGGGSEAGGDSQRSDVSLPPAGRLQHR